MKERCTLFIKNSSFFVVVRIHIEYLVREREQVMATPPSHFYICFKNYIKQINVWAKWFWLKSRFMFLFLSLLLVTIM